MPKLQKIAFVVPKGWGDGLLDKVRFYLMEALEENLCKIRRIFGRVSRKGDDSVGASTAASGVCRKESQLAEAYEVDGRS